jgi:hypothetical protein
MARCGLCEVFADFHDEDQINAACLRFLPHLQKKYNFSRSRLELAAGRFWKPKKRNGNLLQDRFVFHLYAEQNMFTCTVYLKS